MENLKILLIGPERSGKSVISNYLYENNRDKPKIYRPTIGARVLEIQKTIQSLDKNIIIELWDVSGNIQYESTWYAIQKNTDGIIIVQNADQLTQKEEIKGWINNFVDKAKIPHFKCLGLGNHPSGNINNSKSYEIENIVFNHCCFEERNITIGPVFDDFVEKIAKQKKDTENKWRLNNES